MARRGTRRGWGVGPWLLPLLAAIVLTQSTVNLARPLVSYRVIALGGGALEVGLVTASFAVLPLLVAMPLGRHTDRRAHLGPLLFSGTALMVLGPMLLSLSGSAWALGLASAVLGMGQLVLLVSTQATIARWSAPGGMDRGFAWLTAAASVGQLLGPLTVGLVLGNATGEALAAASRHAFWLAAAASLLAAPFVVVLASRTPPQAVVELDADSGGVGRPTSTSSLLRRPGVPTGLFASLALLGTVDILTAYLPLIADRRGIAPSAVGLLLALRAAATICSRLLLGQLLKRWRHATLVVASAGGSALAFAVVPLPGVGIPVIAAALVVGGFLLGVGQPLTMTMMVRAVPEGARSSGLALRLVANRVGQVALPASAGVVAGAAGTGALWMACGILGAASVASYRARSIG